ncbi:MAG TPA: GNAT family N-acetyltransferase [Myxococcota bacterium]|jgi:RimJ/RimL family protein N-acetyltransferase|nr:GNAT family N-acetyltransferase [Myxococcota bacterium]
MGDALDMPPVLSTARLVLRPMGPDDAAAVQKWAGDFEVADTALNIPHPYPDGLADEWIAMHGRAWREGREAVFAITARADGTLMGAIGLAGIDARHRHAEMGYWLGRPFWNLGLATEAARAVLRFAFDTLDLERVFAHHFVRNPASGRVLEKIGMVREGVLRAHVRQWGRPEDLVVCGILRREWQAHDGGG